MNASLAAARRSSLTRLLAPASVAVVGASSAPDKAGHQALLALARFGGDVFAINPRGGEIAGRPTFTSLRALGRPVDLVVFAIPAAACPAGVREAIECGAGGGLIVSGGFGETGAGGAALEAELQALCAAAPFRLLGPNTAGFVNNEVSLTASFVPAASRIPFGPVAVVAQSAGVNLTVSFQLAGLGYGVSMAVGLGNAVDVGASDVLEFVAEQAATRVIALHVEGVAHGRRLYETLRRITPEKPVVVLTVGQSDVAAFAASHTGNLLGSYALRVAALRQAGATVVDSIDDLVAAASLLSHGRLAPKRRPGIGIVTAQAGPGLLMLDRLKSSGVSVPMLTASTLEGIARELPPFTYLENPVDTGRPSESFTNVLRLVGSDPEVDAVIAYALHEPAALRPEAALLEAKAHLEVPLLFGTMGPREEVSATLDALRGQGLYAVDSPERLAKGALVLAEDAAARERVRRAEPERQAMRRLDLPARFDEHAAKQLLRALGFTTPRGIACKTHAEARAAFNELEKPVVVKILTHEIAHKTEVGGVCLGIDDERALASALVQLDGIPLDSERRYLVEELAADGLELIVGAVRDASFGPVVMVGLGGIFAEAFRDTSTRLAPLGTEAAEQMLEELRAGALLNGWRGSPQLDKAAVARALVTLGAFLDAHPTVTEIEINPLRVYPAGALALDVHVS